MAVEVLTSLGSLLFHELRDLAYGNGKPVEHIYNHVSWLKIDLEFVNQKEAEDVILDARRIVYDAGQFLESINILNGNNDQKKRVYFDMMRRYCRMGANYQRNNNYSIELGDILSILQVFADSEDDDETRDSIFGQHLSDWIQGDQGSSQLPVEGKSDGDILLGMLEDLLPGWQRSAELQYIMSKKKLAEEDQKKNRFSPPGSVVTVAIHQRAGKEMNNYLNKETCKELVRRCGGLPLAIVQLGELMQTEEWCSREALAGPEIFKSVPMKERVLEVLATSYDELPHELRSCFLYLRNVQANAEIEQVGVRCSAVQLQVDEATGLFKYCRVHSLLRDVRFLKGNEEDLQVMDLRLGKSVVIEDKAEITTMPSSSPIRWINKLAVYLGDLKDIDDYVPPKRGVAGELHSVLFVIPRSFIPPQFSLLIGQNSVRSGPISKIWSFSSASAECCIRRISGNYPSRIWGDILLGSCGSLNYLSMDIKITPIRVPSKEL
ncbi:hypothetical protein LguiA_002259 [Lonicera macranthoides]